MIFLYTMVLANASTIDGVWYNSDSIFEHVIKIRNDQCLVASATIEEMDTSYTKVRLKKLYIRTDKRGRKNEYHYDVFNESKIENYWFRHNSKSDVLLKDSGKRKKTHKYIRILDQSFDILQRLGDNPEFEPKLDQIQGWWMSEAYFYYVSETNVLMLGEGILKRDKIYISHGFSLQRNILQNQIDQNRIVWGNNQMIWTRFDAPASLAIFEELNASRLT